MSETTQWAAANAATDPVAAAAHAIHCRMAIGRGNFIAGEMPLSNADLGRAVLDAVTPLLAAHAFEIARTAIADLEIGAGSEHYRHGRETMQADAVAAINRFEAIALGKL